MDLDYYQSIATETDQFKRAKKEQEKLMIPLLGLAGETGTLLSEFKKKIRDKEAYDGFKERAEEELGDILWYLANIASKMDLSLSTIASKNLHKIQERWPIDGKAGDQVKHFDVEYPESEQLPRLMRIQFKESEAGKKAVMLWLPTKVAIGNPLTDNAHIDDGYRFHDVLHLANMAVLGWSPVMRALLKKKRKSIPRTDEVEDGARAALLEELIVSFVYTNATERSYYKDIKHVDSEMLSTIKRIVAGVEVTHRPMKDWEQAILQGYAAFRHLKKERKGVVVVDMDKKQLRIEK